MHLRPEVSEFQYLNRQVMLVSIFLKKKGFMSVSMDERLEMKFFTKMFTIALSFYRSQNVLYRSKFFEPAQKFVCI